MIDKEIEKAITAYRLRANPFVRKPLDPLRHSEDDDLVAPVDGWKRRDKLEVFLERRVADHASAIVVAAGGSGTGRSSLANIAMNDWLKRRSQSSATDS